MFTYKSPDLSATITVVYLNASDAVTDNSYVDFSIVAKPEMVEGLEVGYGFGETEVTMELLLMNQRCTGSIFTVQ